MDFDTCGMDRLVRLADASTTGALLLNGTLKQPPELPHTQGLIDVSRSVYTDMTDHGCEADKRPAARSTRHRGRCQALLRQAPLLNVTVSIHQGIRRNFLAHSSISRISHILRTLDSCIGYVSS